MNSGYFDKEPDTSVFHSFFRRSPDTDGVNTLIFVLPERTNCAQVIVQNASVAAFYTKAHARCQSPKRAAKNPKEPSARAHTVSIKTD